MQQARFDSVHRGLSSIAKKVFEGVPIEEPWSAGQVHSELRRLGFGSADLNTTKGCLNTLVEAGIVEEPTRGTFIRAQIRSKPEHPKIKLVPNLTQEESMQKPATPAQENDRQDPLQRLSGLSTRVLQMAEALKTLAADIDAAAIEIADASVQRDAENKKLRQLQELLKSLA